MPQYIGSSTPLGSGATYTSNGVLTNLYSNITGSVFADQAGTLFVEQSPDNVNWDVSSSYTVGASAGKGFNETILLPWVRLRFTNTAGTGQTVFRLVSRFVLGNST